MRSPVVVESSSDRLIEALRDAIVCGEIAPGERLVQEGLAAAYGTSRIPLREALRRLEGEGLVEITAGRGAVVTALGPKDVADLFDLRIALETAAVERAAARYADVTPLVSALARDGARAAAERNAVALFHLDRDFHAALAAAAENPHLARTLDAHWSQIMRLMHAYLGAATYPAGVWDDHRAIAEAVAHGDGDDAARRVRDHLTGARDLILARLRAGASGSAAGRPRRARAR